MSATILDGVTIARAVYAGLEERIGALRARGIVPGLAAIEVGGHAASLVYIRNKVRACEAAGVHSEVHRFEADCPEEKVLAAVAALNRNSRVHGIIVEPWILVVRCHAGQGTQFDLHNDLLGETGCTNTGWQ